jgi:hypothetical protein
MLYIKITSRRYYLISLAILFIFGFLTFVLVKVKSSADTVINTSEDQPHLPTIPRNNQ